MKTAIFLVLASSALLYYPLYPEEFETPKAAAFILFGCLSFGLVEWRYLAKDRIAQALLALVASAMISAVFSIDPHMSFWGNPKCNNGLLVWISGLVFYLAASDAFKSHEDRVSCVRWVMVVATAVAVYALCQVAGYDFKKWTGTLSEFGFTRPMSFFGQPNFMAAYLAMVLPFCLYRAQDALAPVFERVGAGLLFAMSCAAIFFSQSRGMWVATVSGLVVYFAVRRISFKNVALILGSVFMVIAAALLTSQQFRESTAERASQILFLSHARRQYQLGALRIFRDHPVIGSGTDTFEVAYQHRRTPEYWAMEAGGSPHRAHNEYLNVLATQGAVGFFALIWFIVESASRIRRVRWHPLRAPVAAAVTAFWVQELSSFHVIGTLTLLLACLAMLPRKGEP